MSELAIVSARRVRLTQRAKAGDARAARALVLARDPTRFLSTVQVGMTAIGILSGAIGEETIGVRLSAGFAQIPALAPYADVLSTTVVVVGLTYAALILGELVPKHLALTQPERIAGYVARPMQALATIAHPLVSLLSASTAAVLRALRVRTVKEPMISPDEFKVLVDQAAAQGVFEKTEQELMTNVLNLDERTVGEIVTPRSDIQYLDIREGLERSRDRLSQSRHAVVPLCDRGLEHVIGFVRTTDVLTRLLRSEPLDFAELASPPLFVPRTLSLMRLLEQFKRTHLPVALAVDEYGDVDGIVSLADVMSALVGDLAGEPGEEPAIVRRDDGSWLVEGTLDLERVRRTLDLTTLDGEDDEAYHTLGGLAMHALGRVPRTGDVFEQHGYRFEIVDMDGNRVDRVLVSRREPQPPQPPESPGFAAP